VKIALAQSDPTVGDFQGNTKKIIEFAREAVGTPRQTCQFPELQSAATLRRLPEKPIVLARAGEAIAEIAATATAGRPLTVICGYVTEARPESGKHVVNSAALLRNGVVEFVQSKRLLLSMTSLTNSAISTRQKTRICIPWAINASPHHLRRCLER